MDRGAWQAAGHGITKESHITPQLNNTSNLQLHSELVKYPNPIAFP